MLQFRRNLYNLRIQANLPIFQGFWPALAIFREVYAGFVESALRQFAEKTTPPSLGECWFLNFKLGSLASERRGDCSKTPSNAPGVNVRQSKDCVNAPHKSSRLNRCDFFRCFRTNDGVGRFCPAAT